MPLLDLIGSFKPVPRLRGPYHGTVLLTDKDEAVKRRRVKCDIPELWPSGDTSVLPWCYPKVPTGLGGGTNLSSFGVPKVGSHLRIVFPYRDIYHPEYDGFWDTALTHNTRFDTDYPDVYGWEDDKGTYITINRSSGETTLQHQSGSTVTLKSDGNVVVKPASGKKIQLDNDAGNDLQPIPRGEDLYQLLLQLLQHSHDSAVGPTQKLATVAGDTITPASTSAADVVTQIALYMQTLRSDYNETK